MGWASGSELFEQILAILEKRIPIEAVLAQTVLEIANTFEHADCDTLGEVEAIYKYLEWDDDYPDEWGWKIKEELDERV